VDAKPRQSVWIQLKAESRPVRDLEHSVRNLRPANKQLRPEWVTYRIWEDFLHVTIEDGGN
jgi:hypothetical protein